MIAFVVSYCFCLALLLALALLARQHLQQGGRPAGAPEAWRAINLAAGDGWAHQDADQVLVALRRAGWHIEKQGNERGGTFVYIKLIGPGYKE